MTQPFTVDNPWWYTSEQTAQAVKRGLTDSEAEGLRWLAEGLRLLADAKINHDLERCLAEPSTSLGRRWDALLAGATRRRLRQIGVKAADMPSWTRVKPLPELWYPGARTWRRADRAVVATPPELMRLGIVLPADTLDNTTSKDPR